MGARASWCPTNRRECLAWPHGLPTSQLSLLLYPQAWAPQSKVSFTTVLLPPLPCPPDPRMRPSIARRAPSFQTPPFPHFQGPCACHLPRTTVSTLADTILAPLDKCPSQQREPRSADQFRTTTRRGGGAPAPDTGGPRCDRGRLMKARAATLECNHRPPERSATSGTVCQAELRARTPLGAFRRGCAA